MKKIQTCAIEDCIPTPSGCVTWNGGDIAFLGICDGDCLNILLIELLDELQRIAGKDISTFDISKLLDICKKEAPEKVTILSVLTLLRDNQLCLKDFADTLYAKLSELLSSQNVKINLKCYIGFNGLGLSITRDQLDQAIIDILCSHQRSLDSANSSMDRLQEEINEKIREKRVEEVVVATCVNPNSLPLSVQVQNTSLRVCDLIRVLGSVTDINTALANTPTDLNAEFGGISGWNSSPSNWAEYYGNTLLVMESLRQRLLNIENVCCAVSCNDVTIRFSAVFNEDNTGIIIRFNSGSGMIMPKGFEDCGSTGTITDKNGNTQDFDIEIALGAAVEIPLEGLSTTGNLDISIAAKICNSDKGIQCNKCVTGTVEQPDCQYCELTASGNVTVIYKVCTD